MVFVTVHSSFKLVHAFLLVCVVRGAFTRSSNHLLVSTSRLSRVALQETPEVDRLEHNAIDGSHWPTDSKRRHVLSLGSIAMLASGYSQPSWAGNGKSRTDGYPVQKSEAVWQSQLSEMQYFVLRRGGTESPNFSILEDEDRPGVFACAGCGTELFDSNEKFHSGTGWPSFARALHGVEVEDVNAIQANLVGAELRCRDCGGHLGDVFSDGFLFLGTPAFVSGKRYCIDGAALVFRPAAQGEPVVRGDIKKPASTPSWLDPPKVTPQ